MTTHTPLVAIERPSSNLTVVTIGTDLEFAFSYTTIVAFRAPTNPSASWVKSRNVWSQTTGRHLNQLPGTVIDHDEFNKLLSEAMRAMYAPARPVG